MKGQSIGFSVLALTLATLSTSGAHGGPWYGEVSYGGAEGSLPDGGSFSFVDVDNSDGRWQLTGGYDVNPYFAIEISYANLGKQQSEINVVPFGTTLSGNPGTFINPFWSTTVSGSPLFAAGGIANSVISLNTASLPGTSTPNTFIAETQGLRVSAIGKLPLGGPFALHFQGGTLIPRYKNTQEVRFLQLNSGATAFSVQTRTETETSHEPEFFGGLGINMDLGPTMAVKLYWEKFLDVGNEDTFEQDIDTYNLGLRYHF